MQYHYRAYKSMEFKSVLEIATKHITSVSRKDSIMRAAELMIQSNLRNVLIVDDGVKEYGIITVSDITSFLLNGVSFTDLIESVNYKIVKKVSKNVNALEASFLIREDVSYLCVVGDEEELLGVVSMSNIISSIDTEFVANDMKLGHIICKTKARTVKPTDSLSAVFHRVNSTPTEAVIVANDLHIPIGIITKRDIVKLIINKVDMTREAQEFMCSPLVTVSETTTVKEALELMNKKRFKRIIVVESSGELMGIITREEIMDVVYNKWSQIVREKEHELQKLSKTLAAKTEESERSSRLLNEFMDATDDLIFYKDLEYRYIGCNKAFAEFVGLQKLQIIGKSDFELFDEKRSAMFRSTDRGVIESGKTVIYNYWTKYADKENVYLSVKKAPLRDAQGKIAGLIGISRDTTEQKNLEDAAKLQQEYLQAILNMQDSMLIITNNGNSIIEANRSFLEFYGIGGALDFNGKYKSVADLFIKKEGYISKQKSKPWFETLKSQPDGDFKVLMQKQGKIDEEPRSFLLKLEKFNQDDYYLVSFTDITNIEKRSKTLELLAATDPLTQIYNRMKIGHLMETEIARSIKTKRALSLVAIDIDYFKKINDTYGHQVGDDVLIKVVDIIKSKIRNNDIFGRWGGEEFMLLLVGANIDVAIERAETFRESLAGHDFVQPTTVTSSFGVSTFKEGDTMGSFIKRADEALYAAKRNGRNRVEYIR